MRIGSVSMTPYIYNTNAISPKSMNKIAAIGDDVTSSKLDVSSLMSDEAKKQQNMNPLKPGQTLDFSGILQMQMQMSRMNEARIMKPAEETLKVEPATNPQEDLAVSAINDMATAMVAE